MCLYAYLDYREFLRDFYLAQKSRNKGYSYRVFAQKAKLASPNYLKLVIDKKRRITEKTMDAFIKGLTLNQAEANYFRALVAYKESTTSEQQNIFLDEILRLKRRATATTELQEDKYEILRRWHHWAIREMILLKDFAADPAFIAKKLSFLITSEEAKASLSLLESLEFYKKDEAGKYRLTEPLISTTDDISSKLIRDLHIQFMQLALNALIRLPVQKRMVQGVTIALPQEKIATVKNKIKTLCKEISEMFDENYQNDQVFHLVVNFFPLSTETSL